MEIWGNPKNGSARKVFVSFHRNAQLIMTTGYGVPCKGFPWVFGPLQGFPGLEVGCTGLLPHPAFRSLPDTTHMHSLPGPY